MYSSLGTVLMCLGIGCMPEAKLLKVIEHESKVTKVIMNHGLL